MKAFKLRYDEKTNRLYYVDFTVKNEFDFSNEPETNLYDAENGHNIHEDSFMKDLNEMNEEIANDLTKIIKCKDCSKYFILPKLEIEWFNDHDLNLPKRCPKCRSIRKSKNRVIN